jgi:WhiB family redox-sensing transcriptional regulator
MSFLWVHDQPWRVHAACSGTDPNMFHPHDERHETSIRSVEEVTAKRVCRECTVRRDCLDYAIEANERLGIWGGMTRRERELERRKRGTEL